jgi:hypothetical protein
VPEGAFRHPRHKAGIGRVVDVEAGNAVEAHPAVEVPRGGGQRPRETVVAHVVDDAPHRQHVHRQVRVTLALPVDGEELHPVPAGMQQAGDAQRVALHAAVRKVLEQAERDLHAAACSACSCAHTASAPRWP